MSKQHQGQKVLSDSHQPQVLIYPIYCETSLSWCGEEGRHKFTSSQIYLCNTIRAHMRSKVLQSKTLKMLCFKIWTSTSEVIVSNCPLSAFSNLIQLRGCVCSSFICSSSGPGQTIMASFNKDVHADKVKSASTPIWTIATSIRLLKFIIYKFRDIVWSKWALHSKMYIFHIFLTWKTFINILGSVVDKKESCTLYSSLSIPASRNFALNEKKLHSCL